ncbi:MAG: DNA adenine methylase [Epulopiscium sp.]|nr:DNA adenine methylase [Candidatus Epulonipiscium sp.]
MKPLIKWPGGKSSEIIHIEKLIPEYTRYVEPFFGGGALYFDLMPEKAAINDISKNLMEFYKFIKEEDALFKEYLLGYNGLWDFFMDKAGECIENLSKIFIEYREDLIEDNQLEKIIINIIEDFLRNKETELDFDVILDYTGLEFELNRMLLDKIKRTKRNEIKNNKTLNDYDLYQNLLTGFTSGLYMHFRNIYNDIQLGRISDIDPQYKAANFYFIREYCYGSMFRYNARGEFNIPYGGISYNKKDFGKKVDQLFNSKTINLFRDTEIYNQDFEEFINSIGISENDFIFLDPPYDTDFSDYEGREFGAKDQERLAKVLIDMEAKFILIIKNTEFIYNLYNQSKLSILAFDKNYTYNVRSRNDRNVEHLIITNIRE